MRTHIFFILLIATSCIAEHEYVKEDLKMIRLNENNFVAIRGNIDESSASRFISDIMKLKGDKIYVYLITPGGSVISGTSIIQTINTLQSTGKEIICIADHAYSMGFVIFQSCSKRYVMPHSIIMQHQVSLGIDGPIEQVRSYFKLIERIGAKLNTEQAEKLNLTTQEFHDKTQHDLWLYGDDIVEANAADKIVNVICDLNPNQIYKISKRTLFGTLDIDFSMCPLIHDPVNIEFRVDEHKILENIKGEYNNFKVKH
jgi:ATP-dependent Clp protease protease subunit